MLINDFGSNAISAQVFNFLRSCKKESAYLEWFHELVCGEYSRLQRSQNIVSLADATHQADAVILSPYLRKSSWQPLLFFIRNGSNIDLVDEIQLMPAIAFTTHVLEGLKNNKGNGGYASCTMPLGRNAWWTFFFSNTPDSMSCCLHFTEVGTFRQSFLVWKVKKKITQIHHGNWHRDSVTLLWFNMFTHEELN